MTTATHTAVPTFEALVCLEPRLSSLLRRARGYRIRPGDHQRAQKAWHGVGRQKPGIKPLLIKLVGWHAEYRHPELTTQAAYDAAYATIYEALFDRTGKAQDVGDEQ